jgi:hypothetical protein
LTFRFGRLTMPTMAKDGVEKITTYLAGDLAARFRAFYETYPEPRPTESAVIAHLVGVGLDAKEQPRERRKAG